MDSSSLNAITTQLAKQKSELLLQAEQLRSDLAVLDFDLARIDAALAALSGDGVTLDAKKTSRRNERKKHSAPSPKKADVVKAVREILQQEGVVESPHLKGLVESKLVRAGFSRLGLAMRLKEALQETEFVDTPGGVRLNDEKLAGAKA